MGCLPASRGNLQFFEERSFHPDVQIVLRSNFDQREDVLRGTSSHQQPRLPIKKRLHRAAMKIRPAIADDVPAVARLVLAALSDESPWRSFFPSKLQDASDYVEYSEAILRSYLEQGSDDGWLFMVLELSESEAESGTQSGPLIVSAAVFDTVATGSSASTPRNSSDRLHDNSKSVRDRWC